MKRRDRKGIFNRPTIRTMLAATLGVSALVFSFREGCTSLDQSFLLYRLPYANGTQIQVSNDHTTHTPPNKLDMFANSGSGPFAIVAAATGVVEIIVDNLSQNCCGGTCGNNYVWISHLGAEWTKYSHLATDSITGDAGLSVGDVVIAGTFLGWESNVGRACGQHLHFEVCEPDDPNNPLKPGNVGECQGTNRIPRFCGVSGQILTKGDVVTATSCDLILDCIQSVESPSTQGNCQDGLEDEVCVQEIASNAIDSTYTRGIDFQSSSLKIDLDWCPNATCDDDLTIGRAVMVTVLFDEDLLPNADPVQFIANCQNRKILEVVTNVGQIIIEEALNLSEENVACGGNELLHAFARWEICEVNPLLTD